MSVEKLFYITTPIYYVTDQPHIGHLYTTLAADIQARYHRLMGDRVHFLTGTDEHGQKIQKKAKENNETPQVLVDRVVQRYVDAWKFFDVTYDDFIRTTEERHKKVVQTYIQKLMKTGDIYLAEYEGWYCVPCETYLTETQMVDGKCPSCGRAVDKLKEESYFFKMSAYADKLLAHIKENPEFIVPESRRNEVVSFIEQGLKDISASRTTITWGIPMPADSAAKKEHKVYVWFDALTNYLSALDPEEKDNRMDFWPEAIHLVGKDIIRFHAVYWPTFLMALGLPLPKRIVAHGWLTVAQQKMSKSVGNVIEPVALANEVGKEGLRYFLFREFVFGLDGEYTKETLYQRINSDLANDYGNLISRVCSMIQKYYEGNLERSFSQENPFEKSVQENSEAFHFFFEKFQFNKSLEALWKVFTLINRSIEENAPWSLAKSSEPKDKEKLKYLLSEWHEALRVCSFLLLPFLPETASKALEYLGVTASNALLTRDALWDSTAKTIKVLAPKPLFPRLEWKNT